MSVSSMHSIGRTLFKYLTGAAILLAAAWLLAGQARAETGLTVEVVRHQNLLVATAATVEGDEVLEDHWLWAKTDDCSVDTFSEDQDDPDFESGWSVTVDQDDLGATYCFYATDSADRQAVGSIYVHYPKISVEQNNDQLVATVANLEKDGIDVDDSSWRWFRYHAVDNSRFGCEPQHFGLDDAGLMQVSETAEGFQVEMYGEVQVEVYPLQADVYLAGQGSMVSLTGEDEGLNFCFQVADTAGIANSKRITVGPVVVDNETGSKPTADEATVAAPETGDDTEGVGQVSADDDVDDGQPVEDAESEDEGSNVIRNIGLALLAIAIIVGIFMLIKRSQGTEDEEDVQV